jgi:acyl dehydratase
MVATLGLFRHPHRGLADPTQMPQIQRELPVGSLDSRWLKAYRDSVGLPDADFLPPLALQIAAAPLHMAILSDARFPFPALGLVHMSQSILQSRPIPAAAPLLLRAYSGEARAEKRGTSFALSTEAWLGDECVWRGETRALAMDRSRAATPPAERKAEQLQSAPAPQREVRVAVPESTGRIYAAIAGDLNPIHQRAWMARLFGFRRAIVHGTWTMARAMAEVPFADLPAYTLEASFRRPVELPGEILIRTYSVQDGQQRVQVASAEGRQSFIEIMIKLNQRT